MESSSDSKSSEEYWPPRRPRISRQMRKEQRIKALMEDKDLQEELMDMAEEILKERFGYPTRRDIAQAKIDEENARKAEKAKIDEENKRKAELAEVKAAIDQYKARKAAEAKAKLDRENGQTIELAESKVIETEINQENAENNKLTRIVAEIEQAKAEVAKKQATIDRLNGEKDELIRIIAEIEQEKAERARIRAQIDLENSKKEKLARIQEQIDKENAERAKQKMEPKIKPQKDKETSRPVQVVVPQTRVRKIRSRFQSLTPSKSSSDEEDYSQVVTRRRQPRRVKVRYPSSSVEEKAKAPAKPEKIVEEILLNPTHPAPENLTESKILFNLESSSAPFVLRWALKLCDIEAHEAFLKAHPNNGLEEPDPIFNKKPRKAKFRYNFQVGYFGAAYDLRKEDIYFGGKTKRELEKEWTRTREKGCETETTILT